MEGYRAGNVRSSLGSLTHLRSGLEIHNVFPRSLGDTGLTCGPEDIMASKELD